MIKIIFIIIAVISVINKFMNTDSKPGRLPRRKYKGPTPQKTPQIQSHITITLAENDDINRDAIAAFHAMGITKRYEMNDMLEQKSWRYLDEVTPGEAVRIALVNRKPEHSGQGNYGDSPDRYERMQELDFITLDHYERICPEDK